MTRFVLECPQCESRFNLRRYVADKRVRCKKCKSIVRIPIIEEYLTPEEKLRFVPGIDPEIAARVRRKRGYRRLLAVSAAMGLLLVAAFGFLVWQASNRKPKVIDAKPKVLTYEDVQRRNAASPLPLGRGFEWQYRFGDKAEDRRVSGSSVAPGGASHFEMSVTPGMKFEFRIDPDAILVVGQTRGADVITFTPPIRFLPTPLAGGDTWTYAGEAGRAGGAGVEKWNLKFTTELEHLELPAGQFRCVVITTTGTRGLTEVNEKHWYSPGVGLVRYTNGNDDFKLARYQLGAKP